MKDGNDIEGLPPTHSLRAASSKPGSSNKGTMVGFEDDFIQIKDRLTLPPKKLEVISIVGMGGIGKTTLARNLYNDSLIVYHFDTYRAWITVSHSYNVQKMLKGLLSYTMPQSSKSDEDINKLGEDLYRSLKGRRYLIVMDDVWHIQAWDRVKKFFPNDNNGSRIILTTRVSDVAADANPVGPIHHIIFLNLEQSWNLLCQTAFRGECCPSELEAIGKTIAEDCKGLPLTLVVIGGLLCKAERTQDYWMHIAENVKSAVTKNDDQFMELLSLSFKLLPHHLRACFLYMGVFPEDDEIIVSHLIKLWVSARFLKQIAPKSLEEVAEEYLQDLVNRNMILVSKQNHNGQIKTCSIHDLIRELCLKIAREEKFLEVANPLVMIYPEGTFNHSGRHLSIQSGPVDFREKEHGLCASRSLLYFRDPIFTGRPYLISFAPSFRLLRAFDALATSFWDFPVEITELVNLRYIALIYMSNRMIPASVSKLRKLQTFIVLRYYFSKASYYLPPEIWKLPQLRHLLVTRCILPYSSGALNGGKVICLESLQTLSQVSNLRFTKEFLQMIRNVKKLGISYLYNPQTEWPSYCLENLVHVHQLENLKCLFLDCWRSSMVNLAFPTTLKKLTLSGWNLYWRDMTIVGSLPNLEVLKLKGEAFKGPVWETNEGEFRRLKFLLIERTDLETWITDETHFPSLQHQSLRFCSQLLEIPSQIGFIPTLQVIELYECGLSVVTSGKLIQEEQEDLGNEVLQVRVYSHEDEDQRRWSNSLRKVKVPLGREYMSHLLI